MEDVASYTVVEEIVRSGARTAYLPCGAFRQYSAALEQILSSPTKLLYSPHIRRGMLGMVIRRWLGLPRLGVETALRN